jgi:hypothetical protein
MIKGGVRSPLISLILDQNCQIPKALQTKPWERASWWRNSCKDVNLPFSSLFIIK